MKKFRNKISKIAAIVAVTAALLGSVLSVDAATIKTTDKVKLREGTSTDTAHLDTIEKGVELQSDDSKDVDGYTWYKVNYNGKDGYVRGDFAEVVESAEEEESSEEAVDAGTMAGIGGDNVNVRSEASEDGEIIATAESGKDYEVIGETTDDNGNTWYKISVDGQEGYVNANDVSVSSGDEAAAEEPVNTDSTEIANVISSRIIPGDVALEKMTIDEATLNDWASGNYYVLYTTDNKGGDKWYLYSLSDKKFEQIPDLHADQDTEKKESKGGVSIIVVIVMAIIIVGLIVALVFTNLRKGGGIPRKSRSYDSYDDEDDEDDYEDDDYEDDDYEDDEYEDDEEEYEPAPKKRGLFGGKKDKKKSKKYDDEDDDYYDDDDYEDEDYDDDEYEDDDYEFDFLNMDK